MLSFLSLKAINFNDVTEYKPLITVFKREKSKTETNTPNDQASQSRKKKFKMISNDFVSMPSSASTKLLPEDRSDLLKLVRRSLPKEMYKIFLMAVTNYQKTDNFNQLFDEFVVVFGLFKELDYIFKGMHRFLKDQHKPDFFRKLQTRT